MIALRIENRLMVLSHSNVDLKDGNLAVESRKHV